MPARPKRPFAVTCLVALVLTLTGVQILRAWTMLANWDFLSSLPLSVPPIYLLLSALFWGTLGVFLALGVWGGCSWAPKSGRWAALAFAFFGWLDRVILQANGPQHVNWPFNLFLTGLLLVSVFAVFSLPEAQAYFGEKNG